MSQLRIKQVDGLQTALDSKATGNIYTLSSTLTGDRVITTGNNTFDIKLGVNSKFHIAADGRMGIGTDVLTAGSQLTVSGNINHGGSLYSTTGSIAYGSALIAGVTAVFNGGATASIQFNGNMIATGGPTTAAHFKRIRVLGVGAVAAVKPNTAIEIVSGNTDCLLMPIMTTAIRDLVGTPTAGHFIYNSNLKSMDYYDGTGWLSLDGAAAGDGNGIYTGSGSLTGGTTTVDLNSQRLLFSGTGQRMEIGVTGVGIGSGATTPNKTLVVHNGANTAFDFYSGAVPSIVFRSFSAYNGVQALTKFIAGPISGAGGDSGTLVVTTASGAINTRWKSAANATLAVLEDSGDFGIGTAAPTEKLHVVGNINATTGYKFNGTTGFTGTGAYTNFTIQGGIITAASL